MVRRSPRRRRRRGTPGGLDGQGQGDGAQRAGCRRAGRAQPGGGHAPFVHAGCRGEGQDADAHRGLGSGAGNRRGSLGARRPQHRRPPAPRLLPAHRAG